MLRRRSPLLTTRNRNWSQEDDRLRRRSPARTTRHRNWSQEDERLRRPSPAPSARNRNWSREDVRLAGENRDDAKPPSLPVSSSRRHMSPPARGISPDARPPVAHQDAIRASRETLERMRLETYQKARSKNVRTASLNRDDEIASSAAQLEENKCSDVALPPSQPPIAAVRSQVVASQHGFVAISEGSIICLSGGSITETRDDESQVFRCGPRCRPLQCCSLSPCGRYLAAGEAGGCAGGKAPHVLVFDMSRESDMPISLRGHHYGVRLLGWSCRSHYIISIGDAENEQSELQIMLWSWPQGERLATALCSRGTSDLRFSPEVNMFAVMSGSAVKRWNISHPQEPYFSARVRRGPPQLVGHTVPAHALGMARFHGDRGAGRVKDSLVAISWGYASTLFILTRRGRLTAVVGGEAERSADVGAQGLQGQGQALVWTKQLCDWQRPQGLLLCGFSGGLVMMYDAAMLERLVTLPAAWQFLPGPDAIGISVSLEMDAFWVLHSDKSLARWRHVGGEPGRLVKAPVTGMKDVRSIPGSDASQIVTCTENKLQLWSEIPGAGLALKHQRPAPGTSRTGEVTALACSSWAVACGHKGGQIHLMSLPDLFGLNCEVVKQGGDVVALCFGSSSHSEKPGSLLLASASRDRAVTIFRIDPRRCDSIGNVQAVDAATLLTIPNHAAAMQCIALVGTPGTVTAQLAVCTADKSLLLRELEVGPTTAIVRRSHKHISRSKSWVGVCPHPDRNVFFAACGDRRLLQLHSSGRYQHALRIGGPDAELCAPLRLCQDGKLLAVGVTASGLSSNSIISARSHWNPGVLIFDVSNGAPKSLALLSGHAEPPIGLAFLGGRLDGSVHVLTCYGDGAMLVWEAPQQKDSPSSATGIHQQTSREHCLKRLTTNAEPNFVKLTTEAQDPRTGVEARLKWDPVTEMSPEPMRRKYHDKEAHTAPAKVKCPDGVLERILSASPPPKWAETSMHELSGVELVECHEPSMNLGRWGRDSRVGAQVRSASDLHSMEGMERVRDSQVGGATPANRVASKSPNCCNLWAGGGGGPTGSSGERCLRSPSVVQGSQVRSSSERSIRSPREGIQTIEQAESKPMPSSSASASEFALLASDLRSPPPSNSKASRSTPSTVPHIGSPGSRRESPGMPELAGIERCEGNGSIFDGVKIKGRLFEAEPVCFSGGTADFVHVDERELPNQVQMTPVCDSPMESFVLMPSENSGDGSTVSFNLSPINRPRTKPWMNTMVSAPAPEAKHIEKRSLVLDSENQKSIANIIPAAESKTVSKVAAMCSLWEQKLGSSSSVVVTRGSTGSRGRSSTSAKMRSKSASAEFCLQKLTAHEDRTKRATRSMEAVLRELRIAGGSSDPRSPASESSISENSDSLVCDNVSDSPTAKVFQGLHKHNKNMWRSTRLVTKALINVLKDEDCFETVRTQASSTTTGLSKAIGGLRHEVLKDPVERSSTRSQLQVESMDRRALQESELIAASKLPTTLGMEPKRDRKSKPDSPRMPAITQPEEEADGPLPGRRSKRFSSETCERTVVEGSRQSTISDVEPAREPQPLSSPRYDAVAELSLSRSSTPFLESPGAPTSVSPARPSVSGPEHEEFVTTEAESSLESPGSGYHLDEEEQAEDEFLDFSHIIPCEDGMDRQTTMLHHLEQNELRREIHIIVPEGMGADRKVTFTFEEKQHEIIVPDGYKVREQVLVTLTNRPFLERTAAQASRRGHTNADFPDRWYIIDNLRHSLRNDKDNSKLDSHEFKYRYQLYGLLRGKSATPLLSILPEDAELE